MVEILPSLKNPLANSTSASQRQQTSSISISAGNGRALSESSDTSGALTPTSNQGHSPRSPNSQSGSAHCSSPLPSVERGIEALGIDNVNVTLSPPPAHDSPTSSVNIRFEELQLGRSASATPDRRAALSPDPQHGKPSRPRSRRRSSSRNHVQRHEVDQEEPPTSRFYRRDFQDALAQSQDLARQIADALSSSNLHTDESSAIHDLHSQAKDASRYCGPKNWKIGLVGDSGAGEYNLIPMII